MARALTATEEQIIDGLRKGLLDAEIAVRLGISIGDLKHRITAILRDFRLLGRESLLDWMPPAPGDPEADLPAAAPEPDGARTLVAGGFALAAVAVAMLALLMVKPWETVPGGEAAVPRSTPDAVAIPPALQPALRASRDQEVHQGHSISLDNTFALLLKSWDTSGMLVGIDRVYRNPVSGETAKESVWRMPAGGRFTGVQVGQWRKIAVSYEDPGGSSWLLESLDGGSSWGTPIAIGSDRGPLFTGAFGTVLSPPSVGSGGYQLVREGVISDLSPPPDALAVEPAGVGPGDALLWHAGGGSFIDSDGVERIAVFTNGRPVSFVQSITWLPEKRYGVVIWRSESDYFTTTITSEGITRTTLPGNPGDLVGGAGVVRFIGTFCYAAYVTDLHPWYPCVPVLYHPGRATIHAINDRLLAIPESEPGSIVGSIPGPFVRVRDGDTCAPLYSRLGEPPIDCAAPGSLTPITRFRSFGNAGPEEPLHAAFDGAFYVQVAPRGGGSAWVGTAYVEIGFPPPIIPYPEMMESYRPAVDAGSQ
jgi:DNA-binding CsgD family transcriptional regulator